MWENNSSIIIIGLLAISLHMAFKIIRPWYPAVHEGQLLSPENKIKKTRKENNNQENIPYFYYYNLLNCFLKSTQ